MINTSAGNLTPEGGAGATTRTDDKEAALLLWRGETGFLGLALHSNLVLSPFRPYN